MKRFRVKLNRLLKREYVVNATDKDDAFARPMHSMIKRGKT